MPASGSEMIEVSGTRTSAATATTRAPLSRARSTSGSYEIAKSAFPAATSFSGAAGSDGARIATSRPRSRNAPAACAA